MNHLDLIEQARQETTERATENMEFIRLMAFEQEAREVLRSARSFVINAVEDRVRIPGFDPASHNVVVAIDRLMARHAPPLMK